MRKIKENSHYLLAGIGGIHIFLVKEIIPFGDKRNTSIRYAEVKGIIIANIVDARIIPIEPCEYQVDVFCFIGIECVMNPELLYSLVTEYGIGSFYED